MADRQTDRRAFDDYQTPAEAIDPFLEFIEWENVGSFMEPCAGKANILRRAYRAMSKARPRLPPETYQCEITRGLDYLAARKRWPSVDLIVTNPPFTLAAQFVEKSLREARTVCHLLRAGFIVPKCRSALFRANPPTHMFYLTDRPCFVWVCSRRDTNKKRTCKGSGPPQPGACPLCDAPLERQTDMHNYAWYCWDRARLILSDQPFNWI